MMAPAIEPSRVLYPLAIAIVVVNHVAAAYWRNRSPRIFFFVRLCGFVLLTAVLLASGFAPYHRSQGLSDLQRILYGGLGIVWWLSAAWLVSGFVHAFVSFGRRPREAKLAQDLIVGLIYAFAAVAVASNILQLPIRGLLATSGVVAVIIGLALQNSLADVFSGIVLNIERPYRIGDWIILDDNVQGQVVEMNWRATHILTGRHDIAIVPNSVIAKLKIVNCSAPTPRHGASLRIKLEPTMAPAAACDLVRGVALGVSQVQSAPPPNVTVKDLSAETMELELSYSVADISSVDAAQNEIFERLFRATSAVGLGFSPRLAPAADPALRSQAAAKSLPERLVSGLELFASLTTAEKQYLAEHMVRREYEAGALVAAKDTVTHALHIVTTGVLVGTVEHDGVKGEIARLGPGTFFGELGMLTGAPLMGEITALTHAVVYEVPTDAISPCLQNRPSLADQLSQTLARRMARIASLEQGGQDREAPEPLAKRLASTMRHIFSL